MLKFCRHGLSSLMNYPGFSVFTVVNAKSHYDALGITPHATQSDIKAAYYKLSMNYHPDKNKGSEEASQKFRDITTAYEVLGNYRLRKLYDKGLIHTVDANFGAKKEEEEEDDQTKFYKSRLKKEQPPTPTGRTPIFNFDEWSSAHYGNVFERKKTAKVRSEMLQQQKKIQAEDIKSEIIVFGIGICIICGYLIHHWADVNFDVVDDPNNSSSE